MSGRKISQLTKYLIAMLLIEAWRLKAECIQICVCGAAAPCFFFSRYQKAMPVSAPAQLIFHPQQIQVKPAPIRGADHPSHDFLIGRAKHEAQALAGVFACLLDVEAVDALTDSLPFRLIDLGDRVSFIHDFVRFPSRGS
jgi:hypothetical protein